MKFDGTGNTDLWILRGEMIVGVAGDRRGHPVNVLSKRVCQEQNFVEYEGTIKSFL